MKYILNSQADGIDFGRYACYLETVKAAIPPHVYAFAADPRHFDLTSPSSLHDAWLEEVTAREVASGKRHEVRRLLIKVRLLGPFHDRHIHLAYEGVTGYRWEMPSRRNDPRREHVAHGDLYTHEVCSVDNGLLSHEIRFESGTTFFVECANIRHRETPIGAG